MGQRKRSPFSWFLRKGKEEGEGKVEEEGVRLGEGVVRPGKPENRFCATLVRLSQQFFT